MASIELPWLDSPTQFPPTQQALLTPAGLLAASDHLNADWLMASYPKGIFPWYSADEPVLWWSTNPRTVLHVEQFKLHRSLRKTLAHIAHDSTHEIRMNNDFEQTMRACANEPRTGQQGTWITEDIIDAYCTLHHRGFAHSIEHWHNQTLIGGLYCVSFGAMVYGESMFSRQTDASKVAFAYFIHWLKTQNVRIIDCQQATPHLLSLGATTLPRSLFEQEMADALSKAPLPWKTCTLAWTHDKT
jgi:leucyl/phenylalanyl-tRNA---protein transferase